VIRGALRGGHWSLYPRARPGHRHFKPVTKPIPTTPATRVLKAKMAPGMAASQGCSVVDALLCCGVFCIGLDLIEVAQSAIRFPSAR
jgi:hypothetical protein